MSQRQVWKYPVPITDHFELEMPEGAEILHVAAQYDEPCVWVLVAPDRANQKRAFNLRGTGHPIENPGRHVGSFVLRGGALVLHLFEVAR